nr:hypothetical protein [uncultured Anaerosporobacter sp.]
MSITRYDGANFVDVSTVKRFDGANWIDVNSNKRYDGANWIETLEQQLVVKRVAFNGPAVTDYSNARLTDTVSADGKTYSFTSFGQQNISRYIWLQAIGVTVKQGDVVKITIRFDSTNGSYLRVVFTESTTYDYNKVFFVNSSNVETTITVPSAGNFYLLFLNSSGYTYTSCEYLNISALSVNGKTYKDILFSK